MISYCCFLGFEIAFVYFMFPETSGRTLEELAFREFISHCQSVIANNSIVFEDKSLSDKAVLAVEKVVHDDAHSATIYPEKTAAPTHSEQVENVEVSNKKA